MFRLTVLVLAVFEAKGQVGLYTRRRYRVFNDDNTTDPCPGGCQETDVCISTSGSNFWIDSECYSDRFGRSKAFIEDGQGTVCRASYVDNDCQAFSTCSNNTIGSCDSGSSMHDFYPDFCVLSDEPVDDYIVPLAELFFYGSLEDCNNPDETGAQFTIPADQDLCLAELATSKDFTRSPGGTRSYCDESGNLIFDLYLDRQCSQQSEETQISTRVSRSSECQLEPDGGGATRISCDFRYFCKDLDGTPAGVRTEARATPAPVSPAPVSPAPSSAPSVDSNPSTPSRSNPTMTPSALASEAPVLTLWFLSLCGVSSLLLVVL